MTAIERVHIRAALDRVLAADIESPHRRPASRQFRDGRLGGALRRSRCLRKHERCGGSANRSPASHSPARWVPAKRCASSPARVMPQGADTVVMQERATEAADGVTHRAGRRIEGGSEPSLRRRGSEARRDGVSRRATGASGRARHARVARHQRSQRLPQAARRVLLDRRRAAFDRAAARRRRDLRQQPLHALRHADAARIARSSTWASCPTCPKRSSARFAAPRPPRTS